LPPASRLPLWPAALLVVAALCAWSNSYGGPFVFDDGPSIVDNPTILRLWPPDWLHPPGDVGETVGGRPLVNFTLAVNFALGGPSVRGYHVMNLVIHVLAGLTLLGLARRTLALPRFPERVRGAATPLATTIAGLWMLHPLQTSAVTYVIQRAEALAGLWVLLTLYALVRAAAPASAARPAVRRRWSALAVLACWLGAATKETAAAAPILALLWDGLLLSGSFREALRARGRLHAALAASWLLMAALVVPNFGRGGTVGPASRVGVWPYLLTQCMALARYLGLAFWPRPLVFDYGTSTVRTLSAVLPQAILVVALLGATVVALGRRWAAALLGAWFFLILAPSSSVVPVATQTMAEHRMYLPLAAVVAGTVLVLHRAMGWRAFALLAAAGVALGAATWTRNQDYRTEERLWQDTIAKYPENARIYGNAGHVFLRQGRPQDALPLLQHAVELDPHLVSAKSNYGNALREVGRVDEAVATLREVVAEEPEYANGRVALGTALAQVGQVDEAMREYREAMRIAPDTILIRTNLGAMLIDRGETAEALELLRAALVRAPLVAEVRLHLGRALVKSGQPAEGIADLREAVRLKPALPTAHFELAQALVQAGDLAGAIEEFRADLALDGSQVHVRNNLANALVRSGRIPEAIGEYEAVLRAEPDNAAVRHNLDYALQLQRGGAGGAGR
jgi:tetratricopeptide (TPR) repeat protein